MKSSCSDSISSPRLLANTSRKHTSKQNQNNTKTKEILQCYSKQKKEAYLARLSLHALPFVARRPAKVPPEAGLVVSPKRATNQMQQISICNAHAFALFCEMQQKLLDILKGTVHVFLNSIGRHEMAASGLGDGDGIGRQIFHEGFGEVTENEVTNWSTMKDIVLLKTWLGVTTDKLQNCQDQRLTFSWTLCSTCVGQRQNDENTKSIGESLQKYSRTINLQLLNVPFKSLIPKEVKEPKAPPEIEYTRNGHSPKLLQRSVLALKIPGDGIRIHCIQCNENMGAILRLT